jgi:hypothetical protein
LRQDVNLAAALLARVPGRVSALVESVAALRVDVGGGIRARRSEASEAASILRDAEHKFFADRESGLAKAREALAAVPGRIPDIADIAALGGGLDTRAVTFFSERAESVRAVAEFTTTVKSALAVRAGAVRETSAALRAVAAGLAARADEVARAAPSAESFTNDLARRRNDTDEQGRRLSAGIRKELADHLHDYGRALPRHANAIRDATQRRLASEDDRVEDTRARVGEAVSRRITEAKRSIGHVTALLAASDPRERGWVLPTDGVGTVVRSVRALALGDRLTLSFHDGAAAAVIDEVPDQEEA